MRKTLGYHCVAWAAALVLCVVGLSGCNSAPEVSSAPPQQTASDSCAPDAAELQRLSEAVNRAADYWQQELDKEPLRYMTARVGMAGAVNPAEDEQAAALLESATGDEKAYAEQVRDGKCALVKVSFYVEYTPEVLYLGPQYDDGTCSIYILTPVQADKECVPLGGWQCNAPAANTPELPEKARSLKLNAWQYCMMQHQCRALAAAEIGDFTALEDWTEEQTIRYLQERAKYYELTDLNAQNANMLLTIDFTKEADWADNVRLFPADWQEAATVEETPKAPAYSWTYERDGDTVTATGSADGKPLLRYTFVVYNGTDLKFDARTVCIGGESL